MNKRSGVKRLLTIMAVVVAGLVCAVPLLAYKANPAGGSRRGSDWQLTVVDPKPDSVNTTELITGRGFNFSQMASNSRISVWFDTTSAWYHISALDTARVHLTGIGTDSAYVDTSMKVAAGDTVNTARTFYMFESAWVDTAVGGPIRVWTLTGSVASTLLDSIPSGLLEMPMAHRLFGKNHSPLLKTVTVQHQAAVDTSYFEVRYFPDLPNYRTISQRQQPGAPRYVTLGSALLNASNPTETLTFNKVLDPYSAIGIFARESQAPNGVTVSVSFDGEYR